MAISNPLPMFGVFLEHAKALNCIVGEHSARRHKQVRIGTVKASADPATKLIELTETETVRPVDHNSVGIGKIEAILDNHRTEQNIHIAVLKSFHRRFKLFFRHLAVRDHNLRLGNDTLQHGTHRIDGTDPVMHEKHLSIAGNFAVYRLFYKLFIEWTYLGDNWQPVLRRVC